MNRNILATFIFCLTTILKSGVDAECVVSDCKTCGSLGNNLIDNGNFEAQTTYGVDNTDSSENEGSNWYSYDEAIEAIQTSS